MSRTLRIQLLRTNRKRLTLITGIITFSLSLFVVINIFVRNVDQQLLAQTKPLVGADIVIESSQPISDQALTAIHELTAPYDTQYTQKIVFSTNLTLTGVASKLVQVRGIQGTYPLYGELSLQATTSKNTGVRVDPQTYAQYVRDDQIRIGKHTFDIEGSITSLPVSSINIFDEGRTIIMPYEDVVLTELTDIGSRVEYQLLIKVTDQTRVETLLQRMETHPDIQGNYRITNANDRVDTVANITQEFDRYVTIVLIITFILVASTIFIALRTFFTNEQHSIAILKLLGQRNRHTFVLYSSMFLLCFVIGWLLASLIAWGGLVWVRSFPLTAEFAMYHGAWQEAGYIAMILALITLTIPLTTIAGKQPLDLLRTQHTTHSRKMMLFQCILSALGMYLIYIITLKDVWGGMLFILLACSSILLLSGYIRGMIYMVVKSFSRRRQTIFLYFDGLRSTIAPGNQSILMTIGLLISMICLIVISGLSSSFLHRLDIISTDHPTLYILNILPEDITYINEQYPDELIYDTILSRIQSINTLPLSEYLSTEGGREDGESFTREFNVTSRALPLDGYLAGVPPKSGEVSLDEGFAARLRVDIGDTIRFFIQGRTFDLEITSLRKEQRDGMGPFFYIQFPAEQFADAPKTYFWVADIPGEEKSIFKEQLIQELGPHLSFIDTDEIVATVTDISTKLFLVIRVLLTCLLVFVAVSIYVCLEAMKSLKQKKVDIYGLLGATSSMIRTSLWVEQIFLFVLALINAVIIASSIVVYVFFSSELLEGSWNIVGEILLLIGIVFVVILGMITWVYRSLLYR